MSKYETDVEDVFADDIETYGETEYPVFDVEQEVFNSSNNGRNKIRAPEDSNVYQYIRNTSVKRPFYLRSEIDGEKHTKKIG